MGRGEIMVGGGVCGIGVEFKMGGILVFFCVVWERVSRKERDVLMEWGFWWVEDGFEV